MQQTAHIGKIPRKQRLCLVHARKITRYKGNIPSSRDNRRDVTGNGVAHKVDYPCAIARFPAFVCEFLRITGCSHFLANTVSTPLEVKTRPFFPQEPRFRDNSSPSPRRGEGWGEGATAILRSCSTINETGRTRAMQPAEPCVSQVIASAPHAMAVI